MNYGFDIDNTIYHANDQKSTRTIKNVLELILNEGHFVTFITRREKYNLDPINDLLEKYENVNVICANGCYDLSGALEESFLKDAKLLVSYLIKKDYHFLIITKSGYKIYNKGTLDGLKDFYKIKTDNIIDVTSVMIATKQNDELEQYLDKNKFKYAFNELYNNYTIDNSMVNKYHAMKRLNLKLDIAAGDSIRDDYEFVKAAKYSFWLREVELSGIINIEKEQFAKLLLSIR